MKYLTLGFFLLAGCTAADKVALKDCAKTVLPNQAAAAASGAVEACGTMDRGCLEREAADRFISALGLFDSCVDGKLDAQK